MPLNLLVFPYRDAYYNERFGPSVRDLHMLRALAASERVADVLVVNRPVAVVERFLGKRRRVTRMFEGVEVVDSTSLDLFGPLQGRGWTYRAFDSIIPRILERVGSWAGQRNVLLDFTPIARIDYGRFEGFRVWYDHIDNFTKHNRYTSRQKRFVAEKYARVRSVADLVTGVSRECLGDAVGSSAVVLNGIWSRLESPRPPDGDAHDLGFTGFVTDKFDVAMVASLVEAGGYSVAVHGKVLDRRVERELMALPGVDLFGAFRYEDIPRIMSSFRVGMLPYLASRSHDGSPIKLYEYLNFGRPVISSQPFDNFTSDYVHVHASSARDASKRFLEDMIAAAIGDDHQLPRIVQNELPIDVEWPRKADGLLDRLDSLFS